MHLSPDIRHKAYTFNSSTMKALSRSIRTIPAAVAQDAAEPSTVAAADYHLYRRLTLPF
jgi:hypothetical protein